MIKTATQDLGPTKLKSSQGNNPPSINPSTTKIPKKYLGRTFHLNQDNEIRQKQIIIKRIHIRKLIEVDYENAGNQNQYAKHLSTTHKSCHKKKLFKGLIFANLRSFFHQNWLEEFKYSKNILHFVCDPYYNSPSKNIIRSMRRMSKNLEKVKIMIDYRQNLNTFRIAKLFKAVGQLHKLKSYGGYRGIDETDQSPTRSEFLSLNKYLRRLPKLGHFEFSLYERGLKGLLEIMRQEETYEKVTKLSIDLSLGSFQDPNEISSLFRFQIFPNLKELEIETQNGDEANDDPPPKYGLFVVEGLKKLPKLEKLSLKLSSLSEGIEFVFEGLQHLPQLSSFSFQIDSMKQKNWSLLIAFMKNQANLVGLNFAVKELGTSHESEVLKDYIVSLSYKPKLQYLTLISNSLPLDFLSDGFNLLVSCDQIKSFRLQTANKRFMCCSMNPKPLEGLFLFLQRNKNTLSELRLDLPLFNGKEEDKFFRTAISQLSQLKLLFLNISVSSIENHTSNIITMSPFLNRPLRNQEAYDETEWNFHLHSILPQFQSLQDLTLEFHLLEDCYEESRRPIINGFKTLSLLKNLRSFQFSLPKTKLATTEKNVIISALKELKCLNSIEFSNLGSALEGEFSKCFKKIAKKISKLQRQQSFRMNLSF